jgi:spore coat polysaccharide biosynthesis protein SpsF
MTKKVVAIVQARMSSSRLPGKVLLEIAGKPMLARVVGRIPRARTVDEVIVAATSSAADDVIQQYCAENGIRCSRGSEFDVLDRYYQAARAAQAETVVRITADCPLMDPALIDEAVCALTGAASAGVQANSAGMLNELDLVVNRLPPPWKRTYPIGLDVEVCTFDALEAAWRNAIEPHEREHVMPYLYEGVELVAAGPRVFVGATPRGFRVALLDCSKDLGGYRWTVDTVEDLEFVRRVYAYLRDRDDFSWKDVLALVTENPALMKINVGVKHKALREIDPRAPGLDRR